MRAIASAPSVLVFAQWSRSKAHTPSWWKTRLEITFEFPGCRCLAHESLAVDVIAQIKRSYQHKNRFLAAAVRRGVQPAIRSNRTVDENESEGIYQGYYMRVGAIGHESNHWIGQTLQDARDNIERAGELFLGDKQGFHYDVEWSHGRVVNCGSPWANASALDSVLP